MLGETLEGASALNFLAQFSFQPQHNKPFDDDYMNVAFGTGMREFVVPVYFLLNKQGEVELAKLFLERNFVDSEELSPAAYEISKVFLATFLPQTESAQELINELTWRHSKGGMSYIDLANILPEQLPANPAASYLTFIGEQDMVRLENPGQTVLFLENSVVGDGQRYLSLYVGTKKAFVALFGE